MSKLPLGIDVPASTRHPVRERRSAPPKLAVPNRAQLELRSVDLEGLLPADHQARVVWAVVEGMDLSPLYAAIRSVVGGDGRPASDPRVLMALWLYATIEGVGSARELDRLTKRDDVYRWFCGGVPVNYRMLSAFRVAHGDLLDQLLTDGTATLLRTGLVTMNRVAQDGMRVRASAGAASFRREATLRECLRDAEDQVRRLREEVAGDPAAASKRVQAARERAATERRARVEQALSEVEKVRARKPETKKEQARASTTDPEARVMKMADGGFRPAYNIQFATDAESQIIVGVDVSNSGSDQGQMPPMVEQLEERYGDVPEEYLIDGGFAKLDDIETVEGKGSTVYAPVPKPKDTARDRHQRMPNDSETIGRWRERMGTDEAKTIYKDRAATAECVNALARNRGLHQLPARGLRKVRAIALWYALAQNVIRALTLGPPTTVSA